MVVAVPHPARMTTQREEEVSEATPIAGMEPKLNTWHMHADET